MGTTRAKQLLVGVLGAALCSLMVFLGLWQMQVFESQASDSTAARAARPPMPLEQNLSQERVGDLYGRRVTVTGHFLTSGQLLVGSGQPMRVVAAFRTDGGRTLAVVRGTTSQHTTLPRPPAGSMQLTGVMAPSEPRAGLSVPDGAPAGTLPELRLEVLAQEWPSPMLDGYLTLDVGQPARGSLGVAKPVIPDTEGGKVRNQGYALQWWAFAAFGAVATSYAVRSIGRQARN